MKQTKLNPCPHCGFEPNIEVWYRPFKKTLYSVRCANDDCPACPSTDYKESKADVIDDWNRGMNAE